MKKRILCFGDSNTWGFDTTTLGRFDEDTRWTYRLSDALGDDYIIIEEGLNGRTSCFEDPLDPSLNGSKYLVPCLKSHGPLDLMVIMLGTNDLKERFSATAMNVSESIQRLITMAKNESVWVDGAKILVVGPVIVGKDYVNGVFGENMGSGCHEKSITLIKHLQRIARLNKCEFINVNDFANTVKADSMHIDKESQLPFALGLKDKILDILK